MQHLERKQRQLEQVLERMMHDQQAQVGRCR
jgi:hypothetical protein